MVAVCYDFAWFIMFGMLGKIYTYIKEIGREKHSSRLDKQKDKEKEVEIE
jgi:hypothetical protein